MSAVVGIDLSTRALDLVRLNENDNRAEWVRCELAGKDAWERTLGVHDAFAQRSANFPYGLGSMWWDDVYLVAIEQPMGRGKVGATSVLNRVVGAVAASLPAQLRTPERCWIVKPDEWKNGLGLNPRRKPTIDDLTPVVGDMDFAYEWMHQAPDVYGNALDAFSLALWARDTNAKAVEKALGAA